MKSNWKKTFASVISMLLVLSMVFTSGLGTVVGHASQYVQARNAVQVGQKAAAKQELLLEQTPVTIEKLHPEKAVVASIEKKQNNLGVFGLTSGASKSILPKALIKAVVEETPAKAEETTSDDAKSSWDTGGDTSTPDPKPVEKESSKEESDTTQEADKPVTPEKESGTTGNKEETKTETEEPKTETEEPKTEAEETKTETEEPKTESEKKSSEDVEKKGEPVIAGTDKTSFQITVQDSSSYEIILTQLDEEKTPIASGDSIEKGTTVEVTVKAATTGAYYNLYIGDKTHNVTTPEQDNTFSFTVEKDVVIKVELDAGVDEPWYTSLTKLHEDITKSDGTRDFIISANFTEDSAYDPTTKPDDKTNEQMWAAIKGKLDGGTVTITGPGNDIALPDSFDLGKFSGVTNITLNKMTTSQNLDWPNVNLTLMSGSSVLGTNIVKSLTVGTSPTLRSALGMSGDTQKADESQGLGSSGIEAAKDNKDVAGQATPKVGGLSAMLAQVNSARVIAVNSTRDTDISRNNRAALGDSGVDTKEEVAARPAGAPRGTGGTVNVGTMDVGDLRLGNNTTIKGGPVRANNITILEPTTNGDTGKLTVANLVINSGAAIKHQNPNKAYGNFTFEVGSTLTIPAIAVDMKYGVTTLDGNNNPTKYQEENSKLIFDAGVKAINVTGVITLADTQLDAPTANPPISTDMKSPAAGDIEVKTSDGIITVGTAGDTGLAAGSDKLQVTTVSGEVLVTGAGVTHNINSVTGNVVLDDSAKSNDITTGGTIVLEGKSSANDLVSTKSPATAPFEVIKIDTEGTIKSAKAIGIGAIIQATKQARGTVEFLEGTEILIGSEYAPDVVKRVSAEKNLDMSGATSTIYEKVFTGNKFGPNTGGYFTPKGTIQELFIGSDRVATELVSADIKIGVPLNNLFIGGTAGGGDLTIPSGGTLTVDLSSGVNITYLVSHGGTSDNPYYGNLYLGGDGQAFGNITEVKFDLINSNNIQGNIYGGARAAVDQPVTSHITLTKGNVGTVTAGGHVFGAGDFGHVKSSKIVVAAGDILDPATATIHGSIFGAGNSGNTKETAGTTSINIERNIFNPTSRIGSYRGLVYGGGITGASAGTIDIKVQKGVQLPPGDIYGGSVSAGANGNVKIDIADGVKVDGSVYGGGGNRTGSPLELSITASTIASATITIGRGAATTADTAAKVTGDVVGGATKDEGGISGGDSVITINEKSVVEGNIHGGSQQATGGTLGNVTIDVKEDAVVGQSIYGLGSTIPDGKNVTINIEKAAKIGQKSSKTYIFGGGNGYNIGSGTSGTHKIDIANGATVHSDIYGGGNGGAKGEAGKTVITIASALKNKNNVFGGGKSVSTYNITNPPTSVEMIVDTSEITLTSTGSTNGNIYGGGHGENANITGNSQPSTKITIEGTVVGGDTSNIYGGGLDGNVVGGTQIDVNNTVNGTIYGGGHNGGVSNNTKVNIITKPLTFEKPIYGGGRAEKAKAAVTGDTRIISNGATFKANVYGGGRGNSTDTNGIASVATANVIIDGGKLDTGATIYGGGHGEGSPSTTDATVVNIGETTQVNANNNNIYGGGYSEKADGTTKVTGTATVNITNALDAHTIYGGGHGVEDTATVGNTEVNIKTASPILNNVYGGGHAVGGNAPVDVETKVTVVEKGEVANNVYGGGHAETGDAPIGNASGMTGLTTVKIEGTVGTPVVPPDKQTNGWVYGGGHAVGGNAPVNGKATVDLMSLGVVANDIYGGGHGAKEGTGADVFAATTDSTLVNINAGHSKSVYGGGHGEKSGSTANITQGTVVNIDATLAGADENIFGGGHAQSGSATTGYTNVNIKAKTDVPVYGGGYGNGDGPAKGANVIGENDATGEPKFGTYVVINALATKGVYGGGYAVDKNTADVEKDTKVLVNAAGTITNDLYGGGRDSNIFGSTNIEVAAATINDNIYGGGHAEAKDAQVGLMTNVIVNKGIAVKNIYGGGHGQAENADVGVKRTTPVAREYVTHVKVTGDENDTNAINATNIYGGGLGMSGEANVIVGGTKVETVGAVVKDETNKNGSIYGGGHGVGAAAEVATDTQVILKNTLVDDAEGNIYGGGHGVGKSADITGSTKVDVTGGNVGNSVYGGGRGEGSTANIVKDTVVSVTGTTVTENIYGGGRGETSTANVGINTTVSVKDASVAAGNIYGGGRNQTANPLHADITGTTNVDVTGATDVMNIYGGGHAEVGTAHVGATVPTGKKGTTVTVDTLATPVIQQNVYGGGHAAVSDMEAHILSGGTEVTVKGKAVVAGHVFGGGHAAIADGTAHVSQDGTSVNLLGNAKVTKDVHGGGFAEKADANVFGGTYVILDGTSNADYVYGGGLSSDPDGKNADITGGTKVFVKDGATVNEDVYGGGHAETESAQVLDVGTQVTISGNGIESAKNVYGGGRAETNNADVTGSTLVTIDTKTNITENVYGGGHGEGAAPAQANVSDFAKVVVSGTSVGDVKIDGTIYGGGYAVDSPAIIGQYTDVSVTNAVVGVDVYGGGRGAGEAADVTQDSKTALSNTTVAKGSVYGGGEAETSSANIGGKAEVILDETVVAEGSVYGGGFADTNTATIGATTDVKVTNSTVEESVYGGGRIETLTADTIAAVGVTTGSDNAITAKVEIVDSEVKKDVYGGGIVEGPVASLDKTTAKQAEIIGSTLVNIGSSATSGYNIGQDVHGGGSYAHVTGKTMVNIFPGTVVRDVFGGGHGIAYVGAANEGNAGNYDQIHTTVTVDNKTTGESKTIGGHVFGGGHGAQAEVWGSTKVDLVANSHVLLDVYGGGAGHLSTVVDDGITDATVSINNIYGNTNVLINGHVGRDAYAGGQHQGHVLGRKGTYITIGDGGQVGKPENIGDVHGGGRNSFVTNNAWVELKLGSTVFHNVYGGSHNNEKTDTENYYIGEGTRVDISGLVHGTVFGGGNNSVSNFNDLGKGIHATPLGTVVTIGTTGQVYLEVYGGGDQFAEVWGENGTEVYLRNGSTVGKPNDPDNRPNPENYHIDYLVTGNVYGGGNEGSNVLYKKDPTGNGKGTYVLLEANGMVTGTIFGGGFKSDVVAHDTTEGNAHVVIKGLVGVVHGGGREGQTIDTTDGTKLLITGKDAIVFFDAYGGGLGRGNKSEANAENLQSDVIINDGSQVYYRVFGGGYGDLANTEKLTDVLVTDVGTIIGHDNRLRTQQSTEYITGHLDNITYRSGDDSTEFTLDAARADKEYQFAKYDSEAWIALGGVYGGGNGATVLGAGVPAGDSVTNIVIDSRQPAFDFISGGNIGVDSLDVSGKETNRTIFIDQMGRGNLGENTYSSLGNYGIIRMLNDYTNTKMTQSYVTVYYHMDGWDDMEKHENDMNDEPYNPSNPGKTTDIFFTMDGGVYHPWRPEPHTTVRVEPNIRMINGSKFRMNYSYTVDLISGIYPETKEARHLIPLMIDLPRNPASISKIFAPEGNTSLFHPFHFREIPDTLQEAIIKHFNNNDELGIQFYFPSNYADNTNGPQTDLGGNTHVDQGVGSEDGGWISPEGNKGIPAIGGEVIKEAVVKPSKSGSMNYVTSHKTVLKHGTGLQKATAALQTKAKNVVVNEKIAGQVTGETLRSMHSLAVQAGKTLTYQSDTVRDNIIEGRMYINPGRAEKIVGTFKTGVYTSSPYVGKVAQVFDKFFTNDIAIVRIAEEDALGLEVKIAALTDLQGLDTSSLKFYAYSTQDNSYQQLASPRYTVDENGYLHFYTTVGGHIIITDEPLARR